MDTAKKYLKGKAMKVALGFVSFELVIVILVTAIILSFISAIFIQSEDTDVDDIISGSGSFIYPVSTPYTITAGFNSSDSVHQGSHDGVDFVPLQNPNVLSSTEGKVIYANNDCSPFGGYLGNTCGGGGFGNHVVIETKVKEDSYKLTYGHMAEVDVSKGDTVKQGQKLGIYGNSGNTTGRHLHFQVEKKNENGVYIPFDPMKVLNDSNISEDKKLIMQKAEVDEKDYPHVDFIVSHESSWNYKAVNASSGAYGLCQALPGTKMESAGSDWQTNPITQMKWCDSYAKSRYGSWEKAHAFWVVNDWW